MRILNLKFRGVDNFNQPIFKDPNRPAYYGTNDILFSNGENEDEVIKKIKEKKIRLVYFGSSFNCEPYGLPLHDDVKINFIQ